MIRVLHVVSCLEKGGTEAYIMNHYRKINRQEYAFDFISFTDSVNAYKEEIESLGGRVFVVGLPEGRRFFKFVRNMKKCIRDNGPYDVVHAHINIANAWPILVAKIAGVPMRVSHSHAANGKEAEGLLRKLYVFLKVALIKVFATDFFACSSDAGNYLYGERMFSRRGEVMRNGIDIAPFLRKNEECVRRLKEEFDITDEKVFGNITRFDAKKNSLFVIDTFFEILKIHPNSILLLGGIDGGMLEETKAKVREYGIERNVRFIGVRNDVKDCLALMDVYLFPSLYEGLGIVLLEAQAAGVRCYASTGVSKEADLGLGLVTYLDLSLGAAVWAKKICENLQGLKLDENEVVKAFDYHGYNIDKSVEFLANKYKTRVEKRM